MLCHTFRQSASRKAMKLKSLNDLHVIVCLKTYLQPKTIKIIDKIFTKFKDLSTYIYIHRYQALFSKIIKWELGLNVFSGH